MGFAQFGNDLYTGRRQFDFIGRRKIWYLVSAVLLALTLVGLFGRGINLGLEFTGGTDFRVAGVSDTTGYEERASDALSDSVGAGEAVLDLDYAEDSTAGSDGNFVLTADGAICEAQLTAEGATFDEEGLLRLLRLARIGCGQIFEAQRQAVGR